MKTIFILLAFIVTFFSTNVFAEQSREVSLCPYEETIVVKDAPPGTHILKLSADGLSVKQQGANQFIIYGRPPCHNGTATARIGLDDQNYVDITFHDGPLMYLEIKSVVSPKFSKIIYSKWDPDYGRHYYELSFIPKPMQ